ncbi:hypothetical protein ACLIYM_21440 [Streptomyces fenghuangensis]|uniref:Uncharacterized protein n=2 Tax=Streptomyces TaxID=1883 RepID=A0A1H9EPC2_9ACTN|nr:MULTISPECIES: hypothetical protein [Streptomyces]MCG3040337.1 hypothetical protein [Streptomyces sp. ICN903]MDH2410250.1 hypothetical protein [Streptomyces chitinivorans]URN12304.1 hypothetical protein LUW77_13315 [Streptomyces radiopugnans]SEQ27616.1 hypothetical protein SAMN05216481_105237 [Streptomyces radiopugnans]
MSVLVEKVNAGVGRPVEDEAAPVMATPAAFAAGVVAGAKASAILVAAAGVGAAVANAQK